MFVVAWVSDEFGFPLKVQTPIDGRTVELRSIKRGPQAAALFALPAGYSPAPAESEPPPEWAKQVAGAPVFAPPFEQTLTEGKILRIRPQAGGRISLQGTNAGNQPCAFAGVAFKDGRPLDDPMMNTVNLEPTDSVTMTFTEGPAEADDIVIRATRGTVKFKAAFIPASPGAPATKPSATP